AELLQVHGQLICYQGGLIRDSRTGEVYAHTAVPSDLAAEAIELLEAVDIFVIAYIEERLWVARARPELDLYLSWHPEEPEIVIEPALARAVASAAGAPSPTPAASKAAKSTTGAVAAVPPTKLLF